MFRILLPQQDRTPSSNMNCHPQYLACFRTFLGENDIVILIGFSIGPNIYFLKKKFNLISFNCKYS